MPTYRRAILLLDTVDRAQFDHFASLYGQLREASAAEIWSHYAVIGAKRSHEHQVSRKSPPIETYLLIRHLRERGIPYQLWYRDPLFIHNDALYRITRYGVVHEDLTDTCLVTLRDTWSHPFYGILESLLAKRRGHLAKPNRQTMRNTGCMNKFYALRELYAERRRFIHDITIPLNLQPPHYPAFLNFLRLQLGPRVVFKFDCQQEGRGVVFRDLAETGALERVTPLLERARTTGRELFVTPAYNIAREYRCYFTRNAHVQLFSIKQRINLTPFKRMVDQDNLEIHKNVKVLWQEVRPGSDAYKRAATTAHELLGHLSYDAGCIEFAETRDGRTVFLEVNQMAGPLPFAGADVALTSAFYDSIFDMILNPARPTG